MPTSVFCSIPIYPAIAFNLDGTLTLSLDVKVENAGRIWSERYSVSPETVQIAYRKYSGIPRERLFQSIAKEVLNRQISNEEYRLLSDEFTKRNNDVLYHYPFVDGAEALLSNLDRAGVKMMVSSSAEPAEVEARLDGMRESSFFTVILGSHGEFHKGQPHLERFAELVGYPVSEILMIGDEPNDLKLARKAGAKIALVAQTRSISELEPLKPDILTGTLEELRSFLFQK